MYTSIAAALLLGATKASAASLYDGYQTVATVQSPEQVRLAYAGVANGMMVSWNTFGQQSNPTVYYGESMSNLNQSASSNVSVTYPTSLTYNNHVRLSNLKPNTTYYYRPVGGNETYNFKTALPAGAAGSFSVAVVIDLGTMGALGLTTTVGSGGAHPLLPGDNNTIQSLQAHKSGYEFIMHPGDIAYADYWLKEEIQGHIPNTTISGGVEVYEKILNTFYDEMTAVTTSMPYMVGPGNHEANCDNGGTTDKTNNITYTDSICIPGQTNFTGFRNHFRMPSTESGGTGNFWYSFDYGMAHFIQLDTETDLGHGFIAPDEPGGVEGQDAGPFNTTMDAQTNWLAKDLAAVNRTKTPWIIVAGHRPWYLSHANASGTICWTCKDVFEPLFLQYSVDLVLSGHAHVYERNAPLANGVVDPNELNNPSAPWYITNGAGGHYDGLDSLQRPLQNYSRAAFDDAYGWSRLTFHNCSAMTHDFVASRNGSILDTATLYKNRSCSLTSLSTNSSGVTTTPYTGAAAKTVMTGLGSLAVAVLATVFIF